VAPARRGRVAVRLSPPLASRLLLPAPRRAALPAGRLRLSASGSCRGDEDQEERKRSASGNAAGGSGKPPGLDASPLAAVSIITRIWGDRPQHDGPINYAQFMEYLQNKRVLRLLIYDGGKNAIGAPPPPRASRQLAALCGAGSETLLARAALAKWNSLRRGTRHAALRRARRAARAAAAPCATRVRCPAPHRSGALTAAAPLFWPPCS